MIEIIAAAICGGFVGYFACAAMTMSKVADAQSDDGLYVDWHDDLIKSVAEHERAADALATKQARIDRALAVETPKAAHGVRKMARLLRGEEA